MGAVNVSLDQTIQSLLDAKKYSSLRDVLITMNPADIAGDVYKRQGFAAQSVSLLLHALVLL